MTDDVQLAFAHPEERARATASAGSPRDRISVRDYVLDVDIGAFQTERGVTQRVRFNVVVEVGQVDGAATDDVDGILSYDLITEAIDGALSEERLDLLETLAEKIADRILTEPLAERVFVRIEKVDRGPFALGVEIVRSRTEQATAASDMDTPPTPRVVFLSNAAIAADDLSARIDAWSAGCDALILCVGSAASPAPQSAAALAQRRIDLLAIEQNAWVLAGRDPRCIVVGTRTELDWAMKHGRISVWAPSKIVLDAVNGPSAEPGDGPALCAWFAAEMGATDLVIVGAEAPRSDLPVRVERMS